MKHVNIKYTIVPASYLWCFSAGHRLARGYRHPMLLWPIRRGQQKNALRQASDALHKGH
jgi:hypothetical protein